MFNLQAYAKRNFANLPVPADAAGCVYRVIDFGSNGTGSWWESNGTIWLPVNGIVLLGQGANITISATGSDETAVSIALPGTAVGVRGQIFADLQWSFTGSTQKVMKLLLGSSQVHSIATTTASCRYTSVTRAQNSQSSQKTQAASGSSGSGAVAASVVSTTVDLSADSTFSIVGNKAGDTMTLNGYSIWLWKC